MSVIEKIILFIIICRSDPFVKRCRRRLHESVFSNGQKPGSGIQ